MADMTAEAKVDVRSFVAESNRIEGISRDPAVAEVEATEAFLALSFVAVSDMEDLVEVFQPDAVLREKWGVNVQVGEYLAPKGGPAIAVNLKNILYDAENHNQSPFEIHCRYEKLHPFTDGNGRSGRALWAWQMLAENDAQVELGFLHAFYYQTLSAP